jgi:hypothetical protein
MTVTASEYEYPTTARRAFVNLSEAVRTIDEPKAVRRMLTALAGLHVGETARADLTLLYLEHQGSDRISMAESFALVLDGQEKFDTHRFIHHATSDSDADDDSEAGKWSYNRIHQAKAQKTTIEGGDETIVI